ncbi:MAG: DUF3048 domain-containing protein [Patescibacteria group bacterium]
MQIIKGKTVRREATDAAKHRAVFDSGKFDRDFWEGPAGWVLVILMLLTGVTAIFYSSIIGDDGLLGELTVNLADQQFGEQLSSGVLETLLLDGPHSPVDGTALVDDDSLRYFAVMIDNHSEARPASGVADVPLVIESPVEGGITRLMLVVPDGAALERIGPIRSARPYFVDWAREYDAVLIHVGGSPQALAMLAAFAEDRNLNEMVRGAYFWRDRKRDAPHNTYTSSELLHNSLDKLDEPVSDLDTSRPFKLGGFEGRPLGDDLVEQLTIDYSVPSYFVTWVYDGETNTYQRYQGKGEVKDEAGQTIDADNVIVQLTDIKVIDNVGRKEIRTVGEGEALVFRDGRVIFATWEREDEDTRTRFLFSGSDEEVPLNVGTTWIQVIDADTTIEY